jgi:myo-inositol 2-dehydrogenase / D-chiro-inositol 1-dehydrogenase
MTVRNSTPVSLGIVGCGNATSQIYLPLLAGHRRFRVAAAAEADSGRLHAVADRFGIKRRFLDYRELLAGEDIEAVAVVTPPRSHAEIGCAALAAGKHLFIDKPLAMTVAECDQLVKMAAASSLSVLVGLNFRWHRLIRRARERVRSGALGRIRAIRSVYTHWHPGDTAQPWQRERGLGGGVIFNDGVHHFDLWRFLLDCPVTRIYAASRPSPEFEDDTCSVTAEMANGVLASGVFSFSTSPNSELEIFGERGRLVISCYEFDGLEFFSNSTYPGSIGRRLRRMLSTFGSLPPALPNTRRGGDFAATHVDLWEHFADCVRGGATPMCTLEDGKHAVQVALSALESVESGRPVCIA